MVVIDIHLLDMLAITNKLQLLHMGPHNLIGHRKQLVVDHHMQLTIHHRQLIIPHKQLIVHHMQVQLITVIVAITAVAHNRDLSLMVLLLKRRLGHHHMGLNDL